MEYNNDLLGFKVSINDASKYTRIKPENYIHMIQDGYYPIRKEEIDAIPKSDTEEYVNYLNKPLIPLSYLPEEANVKIISEFIAHNDITNIDFLAYREKYSRSAERELIDKLNGIKELILKTDPKYAEEPLEITKNLLKEYGLTESKFRDYKTILNKIPGFTKLLKIHDAVYTKTICPYARDLILDRAFKKEPPSREEILADLKKIKEDNPDLCSQCPHNMQSPVHEIAKNEINQKMSNFVLTECTREKNGLIIPENGSTVGRLISNEGEQARYLAKNNKQKFFVKYGSKALRDRCEFVGEVGCIDHHELDILVKVYNKTLNKYDIYRPWVTMIIDSCSSAIVGSVISLHPNKFTVMECICRAMSVKPNSPICGSMSVIYADNGADMISDFVTGKTTEVHLNEVLVENPILKLTGTKFRRARRGSPNSKPIERTFWTIERKYISRLPAYIGNKKTKRYAYIRKQEILDRYIKSGRIWNYEKFVDYWFNCVVPLYNNTKGKDGLSPLERYMYYPKVKQVIPDWTTMSYFLSEKQKCKVTPQGIHYNNQMYDCPELKEFISRHQKKWIRVYDFNPPLSDSIILLYNNLETKETKHIGVAYRKVHTKENKTRDYWLQYELAMQNWQFDTVNDTISAVRYLSELNDLSKKTYVDYDISTKMLVSSYYSEVVDESITPRTYFIGNSTTIEVMRKAISEKAKHLDHAFEVVKKRETIIDLKNAISNIQQYRQQA